ncbi:argonaute-like protein [Macrophomina phaseolina MS6]|uniref:Argonaute-like protein n=1 Tax=Macrophomina phaseolina (strain MS6) TaxID=1126212 RepID=K2S651_MACPH|nr:argonaute-like protein [Macrophomina phaseolina MS6]
MPFVNAGADKPGYELWIPAVFLEIDFSQPYNAILPTAFVDRMMKIASRSPTANANLKVNEGLVHLGIKNANSASEMEISQAFSSEYVKNSQVLIVFQEKIGFDIDNKLIYIPARILQQPSLRYATRIPVKPKFASWNLVDCPKAQVRICCAPQSTPNWYPRLGTNSCTSSRAN